MALSRGRKQSPHPVYPVHIYSSITLWNLFKLKYPTNVFHNDESDGRHKLIRENNGNHETIFF